tara:strand:- start:29 stop:607 length:579 start_codon:yes stop_codon:yes gene_type:complete
MSKLETNQVDPATGTTLTLGTSGDTITIPSGVTIANSGTATGFGGDNTPAFYGELASTQTISRNSYVKVTGMTNDEVDSDTAFDGTTFTVPSGEGGKYFIYGTAQVDFEVAGDDGEEARAIIYKNGSAIKTAKFRNQSTKDLRYVNLNVSVIVSLSASDTIELYTLLNDNSGDDARVLSGDTSIGGYKLIGV